MVSLYKNKKIVYIIEKINYWTMILIPFAVTLSKALTNVLIVLMIVTYLIDKMVKKEKFFAFSFPVIIFLIFILASLFSFYNSVHLKDSIRGISKLLKAFLIFIVYSQNIKNQAHLKKIVISIIFSVLLVSVDGILQQILNKDLIKGNSLRYAIGVARSTASFSSPNALGIYLSAFTSFIAALAIFLPQSKFRWYCIVSSILGSIALYFTFSRGAGIALFFALLFLTIIKRNKFLLVTLISVVVLFMIFMPKNIRTWLKEANYNVIYFLAEDTRIGIYLNTLGIIKHHPFIGIGVNTFSRNYNKYRDPKVEAKFPTSEGYYAHNNFLHMAAEVGLIGLGVFIVFLAIVLKTVWLYFITTTEPFLKAIALAIFTGITAYLINGLTETSLYYPGLVMVFWMMVGMGLGLSNKNLYSPFPPKDLKNKD